MNKVNYFTDFTLEALTDYLKKNDQPGFRAKQLFEWFYNKNIYDWNEITNIPKSLRIDLSDKLPFIGTKVVKAYKSKDRTIKLGVQTNDGHIIETVAIPMTSYTTVCLSTQVGCSVKCKFCASGTNGFGRNLTVSEIIEQLWHIKQLPQFFHSSFNIVFMGMGEPLFNYDALKSAINILTDKNGWNIGIRRITISTCGVIDKIEAIANDFPQANLAVSLHAPNDLLRKQLMPYAPSNVSDLMKALKKYYEKTHRLITFEYVLLKGINDSNEIARELANYVKQLPAKINLIPYNQTHTNDNSDLICKPVTPVQMSRFSQKLELYGAHFTIRNSKGIDINSACGQLRHNTLSSHKE